MSFITHAIVPAKLIQMHAVVQYYHVSEYISKEIDKILLYLLLPHDKLRFTSTYSVTAYTWGESREG